MPETTTQSGNRPPLFYAGNSPDLAYQVDQSQVPGMPTLNNYQEDISSVSNSIYNQGASRLDPMFAQRQTDMQEQMAARGLPAGASANTMQQNQFGRDMSDAYNNLFQQSNLAGRQEHSRLFGLGMNAHQQGMQNQLQQIGLQNQARNQGWQEQMGVRGQMFSEMSNMLSQSQFNPYANLGPQAGQGGSGTNVNVPGTYAANAGQYQAPGYGAGVNALGNGLYNYYNDPNNQQYIQPGHDYTGGAGGGGNPGSIYG